MAEVKNISNFRLYVANKQHAGGRPFDAADEASSKDEGAISKTIGTNWYYVNWCND